MTTVETPVGPGVFISRWRTEGPVSSEVLAAWKEELGTFKKFIDDVEQLKLGNKKVGYADETTGHMQYLAFSLV